MSSNRTAVLDDLRQRWANVAIQHYEATAAADAEAKEGRAGLTLEMKRRGLSKGEIKGIKRRAKLDTMSEEERALEAEADSVYEALGDFAFSPLGRAAVETGK